MLFLTSYWANPRIHNLGNNNVFHSMMARPITKLIDKIAYDGCDVRGEVHANYTLTNDSVIDFCCGVGISTPNGATGVDMSMTMLQEARCDERGCTFVHGNAENYGRTNSFDVSMVNFALHEMPLYARTRVMRNAIRVAKKRVIFCDIADDYRGSPLMLSGEPYLANFQQTIVNEYLSLNRVSYVQGITLLRPISNHVLLAVIDLA